MKQNIFFLLTIVVSLQGFSQSPRQFEIDANIPDKKIYSDHLKLGGSNLKGEKITSNNFYVTINNKPARCIFM